MTAQWLAVVLTAGLATLAAAEEVVFQADFEDAAAPRAWAGDGAVEAGYQGTRGLLVTNAQPDGSVTARFKLPAEKLAGQFLRLSAVVKGEEVSERPKSWNGVKVMLILDVGDGKQYPQLALPVGTFDWTRFERGLRVPKGVTGATLVLGLEKVTGKAWFDDLQIVSGLPVRAGGRAGDNFRGTDLPRLRGVMHGPKFVQQNLTDLGTDWQANLIRWQLNWTPMDKAKDWAKDLTVYDEWLDGALKDCDQALEACEKLGILVLVDLHCAPGGRQPDGVNRMFLDKAYQDHFLGVWNRIAKRYAGRKVVWAYDLINEPTEPPAPVAGVMGWRELATRATGIIRAVDPGKPVVFEPGPWGAVTGFDQLLPLDLDRVIYSFHMYMPHQFTHQSLHNIPLGTTYPGVVEGEQWNQERLREAMAPAIEFQRTYRVAMFVGEFSAIRWAPENSAYRYLKELIDLFEEYGWDWTYHAFREFHGWSVEHGTDQAETKPAAEPTDRAQLLRKWFAQNQRP